MEALCRKYREEDMHSLQNLMSELGYTVELAELKTNIQGIRKKEGEIFVAEKEGTLAGVVCVLMDVRLAEGSYAEIVSLIVSEKQRRAGIGKQLVQQAEAWARSRVGKIRVRANAIRSTAHAFYQSQGYEEVKTQKVFKKLL